MAIKACFFRTCFLRPGQQVMVQAFKFRVPGYQDQAGLVEQVPEPAAAPFGLGCAPFLCPELSSTRFNPASFCSCRQCS